MSRSYKKTPYSGDNKGKAKKRIANKKVRSWFKRNPDAKISRGDFRKIQNPWDICDYCTKFESFEEWWEWEQAWYSELKSIRPNLKEPNKKKSYRDSYKGYKMK